MINTAFVASIAERWGRRAGQSAKTPSLIPRLAPLTLVVAQPDKRVQSTVLQVKGVLDRRTAEAFITCAADLYDQGCRQLIIDLQATTRIELSGAFALHNIARLYSGEAMLNPEDGWEVLRRAAVNAPTALGERVKLLAPSPAVEHAIEQASVCQVLVVYPDLGSAVAAFQQDSPIWVK